jgi:hypothetical protein
MTTTKPKPPIKVTLPLLQRKAFNPQPKKGGK